MARVLARMERHDAAIEQLGRVLFSGSKSPAVTKAFTDALLVYGDHGDIARSFDRRIAEDPAQRWVWYSYAFMLKIRGRHGDIDRLIDRCLESASQMPGNALLATSIAAEFSPLAFDGAAAKALSLIGSDRELNRQLAQQLLRIGDLGRMLDSLDQIEPKSQLKAKDLELRHRAQEIWRTIEHKGGARPSDSIRQLKMPETPLDVMIGRSLPAPASTRHLLSMAVTTLGPGGAERQLTNTVNGLRRYGLYDDIRIVRTRSRDDGIDGFYRSQFQGDPLPMTTVNDEPIELDLVSQRLGDHVPALLSALPRKHQRYIGRYLTEFVKTEPKIVHCWSDQRNMTAGVAAVIAGVPRVILGTRSIAPPGNRASPRYAPALYRSLLASPRVRMINNSRAGAATYEDWLGVPEQSVGVVYNGIDVDRLHALRNPEKTRENRATLGFPDDARIVGSVIRFSSEKRPRLWLETAAAVLARNPKAHFVLVGDGEERTAAIRYAAKLGIAGRVRFMGLIADVIPWFDLMDVVLMTSSREGTSNTALEAQALGRPLISTDVGGMGEAMVPDESGLLVQAHAKPEEIAAKVCFAFDHGDWRASAAAAGEAFIRHRFSIERMARDTAKLYDFGAVMQHSA